jgi:hypothetical protein
MRTGLAMISAILLVAVAALMIHQSDGQASGAAAAAIAKQDPPDGDKEDFTTADDDDGDGLGVEGLRGDGLDVEVKGWSRNQNCKIVVDWGDESTDSVGTPGTVAKHKYAKAGTYRITVKLFCSPPNSPMRLVAQDVDEVLVLTK